eukprot:CAMPEP_0113938990 /NCGR_PEP_ID=MMETSP1339-20121228/5391_1 /TAXON_ID=94617 /ORGANISM="Fibrocapsa japonica" /LENGTH=145 /DNA_ID=CAMNT_0000942353 /DNA_START=88 /DNA_END=525 /DNA_ORIENTATION=+ /assembly_acc=CAM_ASM_000762
MANLKWSFAVKDVEERQGLLEAASAELVSEIEKRYRLDNDYAAVERAILENAAGVVESLWLLSDEIMFKYASGFVNDPDGSGISQMVGYPAWWLEAVGYEDGPPPPPTQPKCCNPPKLTSSHVDHAELEQPTGKAAMRQYLRISK